MPMSMPQAPNKDDLEATYVGLAFQDGISTMGG